ncbi:MAG: RidA family protein [Chloroflexi bacterium]|nr:RidA family protein [Chloroflexota bacterium]
MSELVRLNAPGLRKSALFSQAVVSGQLVFVSGQVGFDESGNVVGAGDCAKQTEQIMSNLKKILEAAGSDLAHIIKITCYLTSASNYEAYNRVRQKWLGAAPPASTTVIVAALVRPELLIEIDTVAAVAN